MLWTINGKLVMVGGVAMGYGSSGGGSVPVVTSFNAVAATTTNVLVTFAVTGSGVTGWDLDYSVNEIQWFPLLSNSGAGSPYNHTGLAPNTRYYYRFRARNAVGVSGYSYANTITAFALTATKTTHRAGSLSGSRNLVQGELPLPEYEISTATGSVNWSDGGKGGIFQYLSATRVIYRPANKTQTVTITASDNITVALAILSVTGTFPLYPQKEYELEYADETKEARALDGTEYLREDYKARISWKMSFDKRLKAHALELWEFLVFHKQTKQFWIYDEERGIANKVRRISNIPSKFMMANSWSDAVVVRGNYAPVNAPPYAPLKLQINCGGVNNYEPFTVDAYYLTGEQFNFGAVSVDTSAVASPAPIEVYRSARYHPTNLQYRFTRLIPNYLYTLTVDICSNETRIVDIVADGNLKADNFSANVAFKVFRSTFTATATSNGDILLEVQKVSGVNVLVSAITVTE